MEIKTGRTNVRDEGLMDCVGHQGSNDLYTVRIKRSDCSIPIRTIALVPRPSFLL